MWNLILPSVNLNHLFRNMKFYFAKICGLLMVLGIFCTVLDFFFLEKNALYPLIWLGLLLVHLGFFNQLKPIEEHFPLSLMPMVLLGIICILMERTGVMYLLRIDAYLPFFFLSLFSLSLIILHLRRGVPTMEMGIAYFIFSILWVVASWIFPALLEMPVLSVGICLIIIPFFGVFKRV
jgi:hypothetical protein